MSFYEIFNIYNSRTRTDNQDIRLDQPARSSRSRIDNSDVSTPVLELFHFMDIFFDII